MSQRRTIPALPPTAPSNPDATTDASFKREKAEQKEVAGRHKNDGQKPHKGAR